MSNKTPQKYLSLTDLAQRVGISLNTAKSYTAKGLLPAPDVLVGLEKRSVRGWLPETVDEWQANRPRKGNPQSE